MDAKVAHIPADLVVGRSRHMLIASRGKDLQVKHPIWRRQDPAFHFDPTLTCIQGSALIRNQVVQMRQAGKKCCLTPTGMVEALHGEELSVHGIVGLIQQGAAGRHLRVFEHGIPSNFLVLEPISHPLPVLDSNGGRDVSGKMA